MDLDLGYLSQISVKDYPEIKHVPMPQEGYRDYCISNSVWLLTDDQSKPLVQYDASQEQWLAIEVDDDFVVTDMACYELREQIVIGLGDRLAFLENESWRKIDLEDGFKIKAITGSTSQLWITNQWGRILKWQNDTDSWRTVVELERKTNRIFSTKNGDLWIAVSNTREHFEEIDYLNELYMIDLNGGSNNIRKILSQKNAPIIDVFQDNNDIVWIVSSTSLQTYIHGELTEFDFPNYVTWISGADYDELRNELIIISPLGLYYLKLDTLSNLTDKNTD